MSFHYLWVRDELLIPSATPTNVVPPEGGAISFSFYAGRARATSRRLNEAEKLLTDSGAASVKRTEGVEAEAILHWTTELGWPRDWHPPLVIKLSVPPSHVPQLAAGVQGLTELGGRTEIAADPGFGTLRVYCGRSGEPPGDDWALEAVTAVRGLALRHGGTAVVERCPAAIKTKIDVFGDAPEGMEIMRRIKEKFDPDGILNPGRFLGRI